MTSPTISTSNPIKSRSISEKRLESIFRSLTLIFAVGIGVILLLIGLVVAFDSIPAIEASGLGFLVGTEWDPVKNVYGALPVIAGTLISALLSLLIAVPLGLGTAIFLSEDFIPLNVRTVFVFLVELLAAIPSVVYGLWGIFVLIPLLKPLGVWLNANFGWFPLFSSVPVGPGMFPAGVILGVMILPIITAIARDSLATLPPELRQASFGLGATRWETIFRVLVPAAFSGIVGGIMLALGRAMGETMAVTMIIGNSHRLSASILDPANTIASLLANQFAEASGMQVSALMYAGLVLMVLTLVVNIFAELIVNKVKAKYS